VADVERILSSVPAAADAGEALHAFNPPQPGYAALREKLAELRQNSAPEAGSSIPSGPVLKPGMRDARVPLIRARFGLDVASVEPGVPPLVYDTKVAAAVAEFQRAHGLPASGLLTPRTVAALSGGNPVALENTIIANMEMWRWQPRDMGPDRIEVNIPEYTARVFHDGAVIHQTRVVVGQPDKQTPVFAEQMRFIIVNPYWNVPLSIIKNEMMPKLARDPNYFADHGYEVVERDGVRYVRQPPGDGNALGRIKFMFPNTHSVYLHDTNARSFFARDKRALSHGCVRVEEPFSFAEAVMGRQNGWSEARIRKLIGGQERTINLPRPLPILITYFTASVDPQKGFELRDDVYGYAGRVRTALNLQD
jgi:murein L,D-transpeptidase YcbB/YkuD